MIPARFHWSVDRGDLSQEALDRAVAAALRHGGRSGIEVEVVVVDDPTLADLHARFLDDPSPTDVIAFDLGETEVGPAAEIYVSLDCAQRVAQRRGQPLERELALYLVHGALHLCGYDDHEEQERRVMRRAEAAILAELGYAADSRPHEE